MSRTGRVCCRFEWVASQNLSCSRRHPGSHRLPIADFPMRFCHRHGRFLKCSSDIARLTASSEANQHKVSLWALHLPFKRVFQGPSAIPNRPCLHLQGTSEYHLVGIESVSQSRIGILPITQNIDGDFPRSSEDRHAPRILTILYYTIINLLRGVIAARSPLSICCARCLRCTPQLRPTEVESS